ncbi:MAG: hypothetical protein OEU36_20555 [Gammaproteobacteria bacterium]|nr:hypothetical protein [Gammaproteobacteria bacterium]
MKKLLTPIALSLILGAGIAQAGVAPTMGSEDESTKMINHIEPENEPAISALTVSQVYVKGYFRSNGTYVRPHYRTRPDGVCWNNYSGC